MKFFKFLCLTFLICGFISCSDTPEATKTQNAQQEQTIASNCSVDEIPAATATGYLSEAESYINEVNSTIKSGEPLIPLGSKLPACELQEMILALGEEPEVWAMMGMKNGQLEIVFQGRSSEGGSYKYFDFTLPCPNACPPSDTSGVELR